MLEISRVIPQGFSLSALTRFTLQPNIDAGFAVSRPGGAAKIQRPGAGSGQCKKFLASHKRILYYLHIGC
ncbi:hypothetical protein [Bordetella pertussis]|uniref:hypothetical protein n=1 Tax=Bordetella pertussis TaxID=520 RepID=UPI0005E2F294|nr:hypothetical protein [Bordetella pertussis]CFN81132.1 Uncharacterised protein [Bordetella pertussis]CFP62185.1 Uncharacterised protein [Bordetella pertussis]CFW43944.1 Uncharacterised protein [Bordetella pertussis]